MILYCINLIIPLLVLPISELSGRFTENSTFLDITCGALCTLDSFENYA